MHLFAVETTFLVFGKCKDCKEFTKLGNTGIEKLHCSKKCVQENIDCSKKDHTVKVIQFERTTYLYLSHHNNSWPFWNLKWKISHDIAIRLSTQATDMIKQSMPCLKVRSLRSRTFQKTSLGSCQMKSWPYIGIKSKLQFIQLSFSGK